MSAPAPTAVDTDAGTASKRGTIAVTGANRGIGAAIARELLARGWVVACLTRSGDLPSLALSFEAASDAASNSAPDAAGRCFGLACDVTDSASLERAFSEIASRGRLEWLVNNAGVHLVGRSESFSREDFEQVMATNATGVFLASQAAYPYLAERGGTIVNLGSFFDRMGVPHNAAYAASKAAVGALTRCLAVEWASRGIRVLNVAPGYVETDLNREFLAQPKTREYLERRAPLKRAGSGEEVARLVAAVLGEDIPYLTGETLYVDGAHSIAH